MSAPVPIGEVMIPAGAAALPGTLDPPGTPGGGLVVFAHGSGSGRHSPRNRFVAGVLRDAGLGTLLFDLLSEPEAADRRNVFDIDLLAGRLLAAARWAVSLPGGAAGPLGLFGASTGAAAALVAAAAEPRVGAVVSRGGRPDLAGARLAGVRAPTLLIVGERDHDVLALNRSALASLTGEKRLSIVPGATHLFEEPGTLERAAALARDWFTAHLRGGGRGVSGRLFEDRADAGRRLGERLRDAPLKDPLVLAIPRGGLEVGLPLARALGAELDVVLSRKLRAPYQPELALGAVSESGETYVDHEGALTEADREHVERERRVQLAEIERRGRLFRAVRPRAPVAGRSVVVTDDGIATGSTMIAALRSLRAQGPRDLIVAVPVAPRQRLDTVHALCDRVVCLAAPDDFWAVGQFYGSFGEVSDERVVEILRQAARPAGPDAGPAPAGGG